MAIVKYSSLKKSQATALAILITSNSLKLNERCYIKPKAQNLERQIFVVSISALSPKEIYKTRQKRRNDIKVGTPRENWFFVRIRKIKRV